jgi:hypothetical protein
MSPVVPGVVFHQGVLCRQAAMAPPAGGDAKGDGVRRALREKPGEPNIGHALFLLPLSTSARVIQLRSSCDSCASLSQARTLTSSSLTSPRTLQRCARQPLAAPALEATRGDAPRLVRVC